MSEIILYPVMTEKATGAMLENKIIFCVSIKANKPMIKREVERLYEVKVEKVNTLIRPDGRKIAYVKLAEGYSASKLAIRLGLV